ncbi:NADP-dependent oxidoreductase [Streptomyces olivoreticuli]
MRAVRAVGIGGPEVLAPTEVERPEPWLGEVLVRVVAAGVNPTDCKSRSGRGIPRTPPYIPGYDVSGVVEAVGLGVTRFAPGDEVLGMPWYPRPAGAYAEYVTAPSRQFIRNPAALSHVQAAGLPLAGLTAWQALIDTADLRPGQRVLVNGAAGGVGHLATRLAAARGAQVTGTARAGKHQFLYAHGVDRAVDYTAVDVGAAVRDMDVVLDAVGDGHDLLPTLRTGGTLIAVHPAEETVRRAERLGVRAVVVCTEPDHPGLAALAALAETGRLRVEVARTFPLALAEQAHRALETGRTTGKIVLMVGPPAPRTGDAA